MNKITNIVLVLIISLSIATDSIFAENICYKADKNDFNQTLEIPHDVIFDLSELKEKNWIHLSFSSLLPIPYADSSYSFYCMKKENKPESYECSGDCDSGRMYIHIDNYDLYVNVKFATMTNTPDDPVMHEIRSKEKKFTRAERTVCPKPHIFKNKTENKLPFVCYSWKGKEVVDGEKKYVYHGCTRHHKPCKSVEAIHFGKYPNDYESHKAVQKCENSIPEWASKHDYPYLVPVASLKTKRKKEKLLQSITIKDIAIYDLDYYEDFVIAVGEDDSTETRKLQSMDEHHESVMLRSTDGGKSWGKIGKGNESSVPHDTVIVLDNERIIVASSIEGAGGFIILSTDAGENWETRYDGAFIESMKQIRGDTIIAKTFGPIIKSVDGGKNWVEVSSE